MTKDIQKQKQALRQLAIKKRQEAKKFDTDDLKSALLNVFRGFVSETVSDVIKTDRCRLIGAAYLADKS